MKFVYALLATILLSNTVSAQQISGAGASFPAPLYAKWAEMSKSSGFTVNYQSIGSGGGQNQIINRTVDFGASDAPMSAERLAQNNLIQVPTVMGSVVVIVNIPGIATNTLKISGQNLVDIYTGKITKWNDSKLITDNPTVKLPNMAIAPVYRADGSGTTFVFVSYLHSQDKSFSIPAVSIKWDTGSGARGNDGVAATVKRMPGSIGYVESVFATNNAIPTALLKTATGHWVEPKPETYMAAASNASWTETNEADIINRNCNTCYPIVSATYILIPKDGKNRKNVSSWLDWAYTNGDTVATSLEYIPLPTDVKTRVLKTLNTD